MRKIKHGIMTEIEEITAALKKFRDERNWAQFHNPKDLALALSIEASELNELYLWKNEDEVENVEPDRVKEELADVLAFALLLVEKYGFDIRKIMLEKIRQNGEKYPVEKAKGKADKYSEL